MKKYLTILALTVGASLIGAVSAQAQLIAYDGFGDYTALDGTAGGSGDWQYPWYDKSGFSTFIPSTMSYSSVPTAANSVGQSGATGPGTTQLWRVMNHDFGYYGSYNGGTLWMSYMWASGNTGTLDPGGSGAYLFRQASVGFYVGGNASSSAGSEYLDIGMPNIYASSVGVNPNLSLWYGGHGLAGQTGGSTAPNIQSTTAINNNNTLFILIEMQLDNDTTTADTMNIWIDPTIGGALGAADMSYNMQDLSAINTLRMSANGANSNSGGNAGQQRFDEFRIGQTSTAVETLSVANVVPEPASMALLGFGGLSLLLFRRRK